MPVMTGGTPYAIGGWRQGRFHVRCVRFGKLAASYERRDGEQIYAVMLTLAELPSKPLSTKISDLPDPCDELLALRARVAKLEGALEAARNRIFDCKENAMFSSKDGVVSHIAELLPRIDAALEDAPDCDLNLGEVADIEVDSCPRKEPR